MSAQSRIRGTARRVFKGTLLVLAVVVLINLIWFVQLVYEISVLRGGGQPLYYHEIPVPVVLDKDNGTVLINQIDWQWPDRRQDGRIMSDFLNPQKRASDPELRNKARKMLAKNERFLEQTEEALSLPAFAFEKQPHLPDALTIPRMWHVRDIARLAYTRSVIEVDEGRTDDALRSVEMVFRLAEALKDDNRLTIETVRASIFSVANHALRDFSNHAEMNQAQAERLYALLSDVDLDESWSKTYQSESALSAQCISMYRYHLLTPLFLDVKEIPHSPEFIRQIQELKPWRKAVLIVGNRIYGYSVFTADMVACLRFMRRQTDMIGVSWKDANEQGVIEAAERVPFYTVYTSDRAPLVIDTQKKRYETLAYVAGSRILLALAACRDRHGDYPESLDELRAKLGWEVPEDPFSGEDFIYRREGNGFLLYSIGRDLMDDGGKTVSRAELPKDPPVIPDMRTEEERKQAKIADEAGRKWRYTTLDGRLSADIIWRMER